MKQNNQAEFEKEFGLTPLNQETEQPQQLTNEEKAEKYVQWVHSKLRYNRYSIKTPLNAEFFDKKGELNTQPSKTIPDQTLPMREIMSRFVKGIPVGVKVPVYNGEELLPDISRMDLVEIQEMKEAIKDEISTLKQKAKDQVTEKQRKRQEEAEKASQQRSTPGGNKERGEQNQQQTETTNNNNQK
jgi:hypothetical protein